jgi:hypothetical protein
VSAVVQVGGEPFGDALQETVFDDHQGHARGAEVFLGAPVDQIELAHIQGLGENAGGNVGKEGNTFGVGDLVELGPVDGVVVGDVDKVRLRIKLGGSRGCRCRSCPLSWPPPALHQTSWLLR